MLRERRWIKITEQSGALQVSPPVNFFHLAGERIVMIVHGYDNDPDDAGKSYAVFYKELRKIVDGHFFQHIWEVYWPGYWPRRPSKIEPLAALSYSKQSRDAPQIGEVLAEYVQRVSRARNGNLRDIMFIAHSLGCRVVLEAIDRLRSSSTIRVSGICLMAAAVPTFMVDPGASLRSAAEFSRKHYILYSPADFVLHWFFRPGEFGAALGRRWPEAVGRFGNPRELWDRRVENVVNTGLNHGDYYRGRSKRAPSDENRTAPLVARMFGYALPMYLPKNDPYAIEWPQPPAHRLRVHRTAERTALT
jgi:hypothetical protein